MSPVAIAVVSYIGGALTVWMAFALADRPRVTEQVAWMEVRKSDGQRSALLWQGDRELEYHNPEHSDLVPLYWIDR